VRLRVDLWIRIATGWVGAGDWLDGVLLESPSRGLFFWLQVSDIPPRLLQILVLDCSSDYQASILHACIGSR